MKNNSQNIATNNFSLIGQYWYSPTRPKIMALVFILIIALVISLPIALTSTAGNDEGAVNRTTNALSVASLTGTRPKYVELYHPYFANGPQLFQPTDKIEGCPHGVDLSVLFRHSQCQPICDSMEGCVGYNFDTLRKSCLFFSNYHCLMYMENQRDGIFGYAKQ